jgi:hypothetical protein
MTAKLKIETSKVDVSAILIIKISFEESHPSGDFLQN